jgi:hypothetical protein
VARYTTQDLQTAAVAVGVGNAIVGLEDFWAVTLIVTGTFVGTITWEISDDGTTWFAVNVTPLSTGTKSPTATTTGIYFAPTLGAKQFRARVSAWTSGSITVKARPSTAAVIP